MVAHKRAARQHKRHGHHQKRTPHFLKVYSPYIPLVLIVSFGLIFSSYWQPRSRHGVLAYATSMSVSDLLSGTNQQRAANGVASLNLNDQLDNAAQAKANDMVARDYWSHNTPDGNPPWVFITNAGYQYQAAGENLAYGFMTSADVINGWMNSPPHKENLLNSTYKDVGFGFANSTNYQGTGPETVVVAMYASPRQVAAQAAPAAPKATPAPAASSEPAAQAPAPTPVTNTTTPTPTPKPTPAATSTPKTTPVTEPSSQKVSRLQAFTQGSTPWIASMVSIIAVAGAAALVLKHGLALRKTLLKGEKYVLHHALFDITVISLIGLCILVSQAAGVIR